MKIFALPRPARCLLPLALLAVSGCGQTVPQGNQALPLDNQARPQRQSFAPAAQPEAMVADFYKEVVARHPIADMGDPKVFGPYLSKELLHRFQDNTACFDDWNRQHPGTTDKPPFGQLEMGLYSGSVERSSPQTFQIERTETGKHGVSRVYVKLTYEEPKFKLLWRVAVVVVREGSRSVVNDVIYLKDKDNLYEDRLSVILERGCKGPRWVGP